MSAQVNQEIAQLYVAMFGRAPDAEGLAYWAGLREAGQSMVQVADTMFGTAPARTYFPGGLSNEEIIASFYENVLGRPADSAGLAFWTAKLNAVGATPGSVIAEMIGVIGSYDGADPAGIVSAALFNNRSDAAQYYGENAGSIQNAEIALAKVTSDAASVLEARILEISNGLGQTVDAGGFEEVSLKWSGDLHLTNVASDSTLILRNSSNFDADGFPSTTIRIEMSESAAADTFRIRLEPMFDWAVAPPVLELTGVEILEVSTLRTHVEWESDRFFFRESSVESLVVNGAAEIDIFDLTTAHLDATALEERFFYRGEGSPEIFGGSGRNSLSIYGDGAVLWGGPLDDTLRIAGAGSVHGGGGADAFSPGPSTHRAAYMTIEDFTEGVDWIQPFALLDQSETSFNMTGYGTWRAAPVFQPSGASFDSYLNAAAAMKSAAATPIQIGWFRYGGDSYIVVDNSNSTSFNDGVDQIVKIAGVSDLSSLSYVFLGLFPPVLM